MFVSMFLAGVPVPGETVLEIARLVDDPDLATRLETAYGADTKILGLSIEDRETILRALEAPPPGLEELRDVLLAEPTGRKRDGLA